MRVATALMFFLSCSPSFAADINLLRGGKPPPGSIYVGKFTPGGCDQVCEDVGFCSDWRISMKDGACWLIIDREDPRFVQLATSCPQQKFHAEFVGPDAQLLCEGDD